MLDDDPLIELVVVSARRVWCRSVHHREMQRRARHNDVSTQSAPIPFTCDIVGSARQHQHDC